MSLHSHLWHVAVCPSHIINVSTAHMQQAEESALTSPSSCIIHEALQRKQFRRAARYTGRATPTDDGIKIKQLNIYTLRSKSTSRLQNGGGPFTRWRVVCCRTCEQFRRLPTRAFTCWFWHKCTSNDGCEDEEMIRKGQSEASLAANVMFWNELWCLRVVRAITDVCSLWPFYITESDGN